MLMQFFAFGGYSNTGYFGGMEIETLRDLPNSIDHASHTHEFAAKKVEMIDWPTLTSSIQKSWLMSWVNSWNNWIN